MIPIATAAAQYARAGWPVFPLQPCAKKPYAGTNGLHDATTDLPTVLRWWAERPESNIGLRTGVVCDVLDLDGAEAEVAFDTYQLARDLPMPGDADWAHAPLWAATARGLHCYVTPSGGGNRTGLLNAAIDWRGAGGYVVAPPSVHPSGATYRWIHDFQPTPPECPPWLADLARGTANRGPTALPSIVKPAIDPAAGDGTRYGLSILKSECEKVAYAPEGQRNHNLNAAAFACFRLVAGGELVEGVAERCLAAAGERAGLSSREIAATLRSARSTALLQPRTAPERP